MSTAVKSDTGPFALLPDWLLKQHPPSRAIHLYAVLARHADLEGKAFPSRKQLAAEAGMSVDTVDRAVKDLVTLRALAVHRRMSGIGDWTSNEYVVMRVPPTGVAATLRVAAEPVNELEPLLIEQEHPSVRTSSREDRARARTDES